MQFESADSGGTGLMKAIAAVSGARIKKGMLVLPKSYGSGYIRGIELGDAIRIMICDCELRSPLSLKRPADKGGNGNITFSFRNVIRESMPKKLSAKQRIRALPHVQVSSADMDVEVNVPARRRINTVIITVKASLLRELLNRPDNAFLQTIVSGTQPYVYEEIISADLQQAANAIVEAAAPAELNDFYLRLRSEELIYLFFVELLKREDARTYPLNASDVKIMYALRDKLAAAPRTPPNLVGLALFANMSESKMNRMFRQIFGSSIYNYYQKLRMNEAAYLIREQKLSVSEAGHLVGFSNLSHFTRLFEKHIGAKPKKYSKS